MINLEDDEEPSSQSFAPDGGYIPRILFLFKDGKPIYDIQNTEGNKKYKYYYSYSSQIVKSMKKALNEREKSNNEL